MKRRIVRRKRPAPALAGSPLLRNCSLFDELAQWAYRNFKDYDKRDKWDDALLEQAQALNVFERPMAVSEIRAISRSVAKWVWQRFELGRSSAAFSALQSFRQGLGALQRHRSREPAIRAAIAGLIASGKLPSYRTVAALVGCSASTLAECYRDLFAGAVH